MDRGWAGIGVGGKEQKVTRASQLQQSDPELHPEALSLFKFCVCSGTSSPTLENIRVHRIISNMFL